MRQLNISARGYHRILKLARTIADLAGSDAIQPTHREWGCFSIEKGGNIPAGSSLSKGIPVDLYLYKEGE